MKKRLLLISVIVSLVLVLRSWYRRVILRDDPKDETDVNHEKDEPVTDDICQVP